MVQLDGVFSALLVGDTQPGIELPLLNTYDAQNVMRLCRELMREHARDYLSDSMRTTALEQLSWFRDALRFHRLRLSGNACRDLLGRRKLHLTDGCRYKAKVTLLNLVEATIKELAPEAAAA